MRVWSITDTGLVRKENQDAYFVEEMADCLVAAVCDGMGGPGGGREASAIAVQTMRTELPKALHPGMSAQQLGQAFGYCAGMANDAIRARAAQEPALLHMGTTLVAAAARPELAVVTNIGDSRAYLISREGIRQISKGQIPSWKIWSTTGSSRRSRRESTPAEISSPGPSARRPPCRQTPSRCSGSRGTFSFSARTGW